MPKRLLVLGLLPLLAPAHAAPLPAPTTTAALEALSLSDWLRAGVVSEEPPEVVYTWTTAEQIAELRDNPMLLTRSAAEGSRQSIFDQQLAAHTQATRHPISALLQRPGFRRHRYAWHRPWATAAGDEHYGGHLVAVTLKPEAWMGIFREADPVPWRFVDRSGDAVPIETVLAQPERIGLVLHIREVSLEDLGHLYTMVGHTAPGFREYVLCNESMIDSWSYGTPATEAVIADSHTRLAELAGHLPEHMEHAMTWNDEAQKVWRQPPTDDLRTLYTHNLALPGYRYLPISSSIDGIRARLQAAEQGAPLSHHPAHRFSLDSPPPVPDRAP